MNGFKYISVLVLFLFAASISVSQTSEINIFYSTGAVLTINELDLSTSTSVDAVVELLGKPNKTSEAPNGEISYFYEENGVVFFAKDGQLLGLGINFKSDGDEKFPQTTFVGNLNLGDLTIKTTTKSDEIKGIKTIEFICPFPLMCASKDRSATINCVTSFKEGVLSQVVFIFK